MGRTGSASHERLGHYRPLGECERLSRRHALASGVILRGHACKRQLADVAAGKVRLAGQGEADRAVRGASEQCENPGVHAGILRRGAAKFAEFPADVCKKRYTL